MNTMIQAYYFILHILQNPPLFILFYFPIILLIEMPVYITIVSGVLYYYFSEAFCRKRQIVYCPKVSCLVTCYNEGERVFKTIRSLAEQQYEGSIEIIVVVDGAEMNTQTLDMVRKCQKTFTQTNQRTLKVISKRIRSGLSSSINLGTKFCTSDLIVKLDGDCSCDNDMVNNAVQVFRDKNVIACSGSLRARNAKENLLTRFQGLEYILGVYLSRIGLASFNCVNNVSSAFAIYSA